jgi:hypothetical protein
VFDSVVYTPFNKLITKTFNSLSLCNNIKIESYMLSGSDTPTANNMVFNGATTNLTVGVNSYNMTFLDMVMSASIGSNVYGILASGMITNFKLCNSVNTFALPTGQDKIFENKDGQILVSRYVPESVYNVLTTGANADSLHVHNLKADLVNGLIPVGQLPYTTAASAAVAFSIAASAAMLAAIAASGSAMLSATAASASMLVVAAASGISIASSVSASASSVSANLSAISASASMLIATTKADLAAAAASAATSIAGYGGLSFTLADIKMDGVASLGVLTTNPRADHVHPTDTSRAALAHNQDASTITSGILNVHSTIPVTNILRSNLGNPTVGELALFEQQATNKTQFLPYANIVPEYTTDGTTWNPWAITNSDLAKIVSGRPSLTTVQITNGWNKVRFTFQAQSYVYLNWLYMFNSTNGNTCSWTIEKSFDGTVWNSVVADSGQASSWPGHMFLPHATIPWNNNPTSGSHFKYARVTINPTWINGNTITIYNIDWWGGHPSARREIYDWNENGEMIVNQTFRSIIATGTSPFTVASTTMVSNLNVQYLNGQPSSYYSPLVSPTITTPSFLGNVSISAVSSTALITNLNAQYLNGQLGSWYAPITSPRFNTLVGIGPLSGSNVNINGNQIYAINNGASGDLYIQYSSNGYTFLNTLGGKVLIGTSGDNSSGAKLQVSGSITTSAVDGKGIGLFDTDPSIYGIHMSSIGSANAGRISGETTSDFNMYFNMAYSSSNRGFVFQSYSPSASKFFGIHPDGVRSNVPLLNPTIKNYSETLNAIPGSGAMVIDLTMGTMHKITTTGSVSATLPASVVGKSYTVLVTYGGVHTVRWLGGSVIKWSGGVIPTSTSVNGKTDIYCFMCDGTNTYGAAGGTNY